jgi:hypothetical protein
MKVEAQRVTVRSNASSGRNAVRAAGTDSIESVRVVTLVDESSEIGGFQVSLLKIETGENS